MICLPSLNNVPVNSLGFPDINIALNFRYICSEYVGVKKPSLVLTGFSVLIPHLKYSSPEPTPYSVGGGASLLISANLASVFFTNT